MSLVTIAIDGPAGAGKTTIARRIADRFGWVYVDAGAMYRAVALLAHRFDVDPLQITVVERLARDARIEFRGTNSVFLNGEDVTALIRTLHISKLTSLISPIAGVRKVLVAKQREFGALQSVVMDGRDIGTIVFPNADVKIFLDASEEVRVQRRVRELGVAEGTVRTELNERDRRDRTRTEGPLVIAADATHVDATTLTIDEVEHLVCRIVGSRLHLPARRGPQSADDRLIEPLERLA